MSPCVLIQFISFSYYFTNLIANHFRSVIWFYCLGILYAFLAMLTENVIQLRSGILKYASRGSVKNTWKKHLAY